MKNKTILTILFPTLVMIVISTICFTDILKSIDTKAIFILSLFTIFPICFLVQGVLCKLNKVNILISLATSSLIFTIIIFMYMNSTALIYLMINLISGILGYCTTYLLNRIKSINKHIF